MTEVSTYEFRAPGAETARRKATVMLVATSLPLAGLMIKLALDGNLLGAIVPGLIVLFMVLAVFLIRRELDKPKVCLDSSAIKGYAPMGREMLIVWGEPVTVKRPNAAAIHLQAAGNGQALEIPMNIAVSLEFLAAVEKLAPAEHPLRKWQADETIGRNPAPYKPSKMPVILGLVGGLATMFGLSLLGGRWFYINPQALLFPFIVVFGVVVLSTLVNKQVQGPNWSNQHWLEKITTGVMNFTYGSFMSVIAFDIFGTLTHMK